MPNGWLIVRNVYNSGDFTGLLYSQSVFSLIFCESAIRIKTVRNFNGHRMNAIWQNGWKYLAHAAL